MGIEHALLPEKGLVVSGDVIIGADSHTCTHWSFKGLLLTGMGKHRLRHLLWIYGVEIGLKVPEDFFKVGLVGKTG